MERKRAMKIMLAGILAAFCVFFGAGCKRETVLLMPEREQLVLWHYWDIPGNQRRLEDLAEAFNQSQDKVSIEVVYIPDEDFKKQLALAMAEGTAPDIALVDSSDFRFLHNMKPFAELTGLVSELEEYIPQALEICTVNRKIYGQPFGLNCTALFYNKELLKKAGCEVPRNWREFRETVQRVGSKEAAGFAITALPTEESMYEFLPLLWSMGGDVLHINSEESIRAFAFLDDMAQNGSLSRQSISLTMGDLTNQFIQGKLAMMFNSSMAIGSIEQEVPELDFGVAPIPGNDKTVTVAGGEILAVADNEHKDASVSFLRYLADVDRMKVYMDGFGFLAPRQDVMDQQFQDEPMKQIFIAMYKNARVREVSTVWPRISLMLADALSQVLAEERETSQILDDTALKIAKIRENGS